MKAVRWGVFGVSGHFTRRVYPAMRRSPLVEVRAIASRSLERAQAAAASLEIANAYGSYEKLLADPEIEAVYNPLPNNLHLEWIRKSADAGKHILCEKPLCMNAAEAREAVDYAKKKGVLLMEAFMYPFHPQWQRVFELVRIGEIGSVHAIHTTFTYSNPNPADIRNQLETGGGGLLDIGCYAVSSARRILGAEPSRVLALISRDPKFGTDNLASGILDFGSARALFTVGTQSYPDQSVEILGNRGRIIVHLPFNAYTDVPVRVTVTTNLGDRELFFGPADQYTLETEAFSRAVREGKETPAPAEDAVNNMKVLDALFRSGEHGGWEKV